MFAGVTSPSRATCPNTEMRRLWHLSHSKCAIRREECRRGAHLPSLGHLPVVDKPLKSVTHGQCDARPTVTFPAAGHHRPLTGTKIILPGHRGTCARTTCPRLLAESGTAGIRTRDLRSRKSGVNPNHYGTRPR